MRIFRLIYVVVIVLALLLALMPQQDPFPRNLPERYLFSALKAKYGDSRNLDHSETRKLYNSLLTEIGEFIEQNKNRLDAKQQAVSCNAMRWTARLYSRTRDGTYPLPILTDWVLQLRDGYVHGLRYFPNVLFRDLEDVVTGNFSFWRSILVIRQFSRCVFPSVNSTGCPSYQFLRQIRGKSDEDVLASCTKSNTIYDFL
ncbi:hypothetical protein BCY84_08319 [Trypanosoma cruzi cruzi]|nr:hypothetical protein BCY84_08319 [Trypanosoma cruzi cruzi]